LPRGAHPVRIVTRAAALLRSHPAYCAMAYASSATRDDPVAHRCGSAPPICGARDSRLALPLGGSSHARRTLSCTACLPDPSREHGLMNPRQGGRCGRCVALQNQTALALSLRARFPSGVSCWNAAPCVKGAARCGLLAALATHLTIPAYHCAMPSLFDVQLHGPWVCGSRLCSRALGNLMYGDGECRACRCRCRRCTRAL
jgi:hypothetical protein